MKLRWVLLVAAMALSGACSEGSDDTATGTEGIGEQEKEVVAYIVFRGLMAFVPVGDPADPDGVIVQVLNAPRHDRKFTISAEASSRSGGTFSGFDNKRVAFGWASEAHTKDFEAFRPSGACSGGYPTTADDAKAWCWLHSMEAYNQQPNQVELKPDYRQPAPKVIPPANQVAAQFWLDDGILMTYRFAADNRNGHDRKYLDFYTAPGNQYGNLNQRVIAGEMILEMRTTYRGPTPPDFDLFWGDMGDVSMSRMSLLPDTATPGTLVLVFDNTLPSTTTWSGEALHFRHFFGLLRDADQPSPRPYPAIPAANSAPPNGAVFFDWASLKIPTLPYPDSLPICPNACAPYCGG